ncbi:MAG: GNAT family N-acetyltransferase [Anaerolineae bacterium]
MIKPLEHKELQTAEKILEISHQSYEIEASIIGADSFPPLRETTIDILESGNLFYGFMTHHELVAVIEFEDQVECWLIARLVVHPSFFRQGIASQLILFAKKSLGSCIVSTAENNIPAISLYEKLGFIKQPASRKVSLGIKLIQLKYTLT